MSFNIQITGHREFDTVKDAKEFEQELVKKVEKLAGEIEHELLSGVAFVAGDHIGHRQVANWTATVPEPEEHVPNDDAEQLREEPVAEPHEPTEEDKKAARAKAKGGKS